MTKKNNFILVNLNDKKTKKLAETITSTTSRKILNHLAEKSDSKATMSKTLSIPLPTITYHLQKLEQAGLVLSKEFHYSKKGRVVDHYELANKYIIIAPKKVSGLSQTLRGILPVGIVVLGISTILKIFTSPKETIGGAHDLLAQSAPAAEMVSDTAPVAYEFARENVTQVVTNPHIALWFLIGSIVTLSLVIIVAFLREYFSNRL
jgi:DNA-binding transcriptional ArsR family regulator